MRGGRRLAGQGVKRGDSLLLKIEDHTIFLYSPGTEDHGMFLHHTLLLLPGLALRVVHGGPLDALVVVGRSRRRNGVLALRPRTSMRGSFRSPRTVNTGYPVPGLF